MKTVQIFNFIFAILLGLTSVKSQTVEVSINRNTILIGEQISYGLKVKLPGNSFRTNFSIPDSITHFDILEKKPIESVKGDQLAIEQVITFTSFDSGSWYFPAIPVLITDGASSRTIYSDSILINVGYMPIDSSGLARDIKPVMEVKIFDWMPYIIAGAVLLLLIIAYIIYRYIKKRNARPKPLFDSTLTPHEEALKALREAEGSISSDRDGSKVFYTQLSDIFKRYYSRIHQLKLMNKTTGDILLLVREHYGEDIVSVTASALREADAVKFAKYHPGRNESMDALNNIRTSIEMIHRKSK